MKLFDLIDNTLFWRMLDYGYVKDQVHPDAPYLILNYTDKCTWDEEWNEVTLQCRGLIIHKDTYEIVARPFPKFFNHDQPLAPTLELDDVVTVLDKLDGSLGIQYRLPNGESAIATRGSFTSEQAQWATDWFRINTAGLPPVTEKETYLYEIIYPENRIVVDYGGFEGLILLGSVNIETGKVNIFQASNYTPIAAIHPFKTWSEVLAAPDRENAEGFVVHKVETGEMVKVKYEDYKRLHKYMTRVTERHVWECLMDERPLDLEFAGAPDEFHDWVREVAARLWERFHERHQQIILDYRAIRFGPDEASFELEDEREAKKNFALAVKDEKDKSYYFTCFGDGSITHQVWKELKPEAHTFRVVNSDAD
jgi:RNA ligase